MTAPLPPTETPPEARPDAELQQHLERLDRAVREAHAALHAAAEERAAAPLRALIAETAEAQRKVLQTYEFDRPLDAPLRPPDGLWNALTAYRREMTTIHARFREELQRLDLGALLGGLVQETLDAIDEETAETPERLERPEPEGLIELEAGDSLGLASRKLTERTRRSAAALGHTVGSGWRRLTRRAPHDPAAHVQAIALRALFDEHIHVRLARTFTTEHRAMQTAVGQTVARVEAALSEWADGLLRLEPALDRPAFHAPDIFAPVRTPGEPAASASSLDAAATEPSSEHVPPEPTPEAKAERADKVRRVRELTQALDATLHDLSVALPPPAPDALEAAHDVLAERVRRSGWDSDPVAPPGDGEPDAELSANVKRWTAWHHNVVRRLRVDGLLLDLRAQLMHEVERLIDRMTGSVVGPLRETADDAAAVFAELRAEATEACSQADPAALVPAIRDILDRALEHVDRTLLPTLQTLSLDRTVEQAVVAMRDRLHAAVGALPEQVTLNARLGPEHVGELGPAADVPLRRIVETTLSQEFTARLIQSTDVLRQPLFNAVSGAEAIRDVVRFNLEAAVEELETAVAAPAEDEHPPNDERAPDAPEASDVPEQEDPVANARELTVDGLARAEEQLHHVHAPLAEPWLTFIRQATETFENGWKALHGRANAANLVEAQFLDFKTRTQQSLLRMRHTAEATGQRFLHLTRRTFRFGRAEAKRLVRMGQAAAGLTAQTEADRQRTIDALAESTQLLAGLPLVYRRLFSFTPLTDPTLLEGRETSLARVSDLAERWRQGLDSSSLVVTAEPGGGRTSFINAVRALLADDEPLSLHLTDRSDDEQAVARLIGDALGLEAVDSFDALEDRLLTVRRKRIFIVEGLEHLLLRAPGGLDLIERMLVSMSRTDGRVLWIGTMVQPGWRFIERVAPQLTGLVTAVQLAPFTRVQVEAALMKRHARSGLPLVFAEPAEPSTLLARKLGKATTPEARQTILREEFFDGLYRASGPNLRLALLYWLRAADFEAAADTLTLRPVRPLDFSFVGAFDLARSFALKALLQHGSLTLSEHDRIFRTSRDESFLIFESLRNLHLIQSAAAPEAALARRNGAPEAAPDLIREDVRYRLHPLVVAPVTSALRAKNML